jgi:ribose transport system ATP-binding protein
VTPSDGFGHLRAGAVDARITKRFFATTVLSDVSLTCERGEVHAIVGANGAGKSTLMNVLGGVFPPDGGDLLLDGQQVRFRDPHQAQAHGIRLHHQEFTLLPERTVAANILLGREPRRRLRVDRRAMRERAGELLAELDAASIPPGALVRRLSVAQRQTVEIAKALSYRPRILVMDEPTAALAPAEVGALFRRVRQLVARGLAVLYISHRLTEVFELADRVTVLRDGRRVDTRDVAAVTPADLIGMMVGGEMPPSKGTAPARRRRTGAARGPGRSRPQPPRHQPGGTRRGDRRRRWSRRLRAYRPGPRAVRSGAAARRHHRGRRAAPGGSGRPGRPSVPASGT